MNQTKFSALKKKLAISVSAAAIICCFGAMGASAATETVGDFTIDRSYSSGSYTVSVKSYNGAGGEITLPEKATINGTEYQITTVGAAFKANDQITSVTIPEGYTTIDVSAFSGCTALTSVTIPGSLTSISATAFENCTALSNVVFSEDTASSLSMRNDVFLNCTSLASLELPARFSYASNNFVRGCTALTSLTIKDGAQSFMAEDNVLYSISGGSASLTAYAYGKPDTEFTIPQSVGGNTVTDIAMHAFRANPTLERIVIPSSVTNIGGYAFYSMSAIHEIVLESETAPTLSSYVCAEMAAGSKITVQNETVAAAFEPQGYYTYYTPANTTVEVAGASSSVSAVFSIDASDTMVDNNIIVYNIYLDESSNVNTVLLKLVFDAEQVSEGAFTVENENFSSSSYNWSEENGSLILTAYLGVTGNQTGVTESEKTKLASVSVPVNENVNGSVTAQFQKAACAGIPNVDESAMTGDVIISDPAYAEYFIANYDVNNDGVVDIIDITEAQRYYKISSADSNWSSAKTMDVNGDKTVDIEDYIAIFNNIINF